MVSSRGASSSAAVSRIWRAFLYGLWKGCCNIRQRRGSAAVNERGEDVADEKKNMRRLLAKMLSMPATGAALEVAESVGVTMEAPTNMMAVTAALIRESINGNVKAIKAMQEISGEDEYLKIQRERLRIEKRRLKMDELKFKSANPDPDEIEDDALSAALLAEAELMNADQQ